MTLILLQINSEYHREFDPLCLMRAPRGDTLKRRLTEFAHLTGLPLEYGPGGLNYPALLRSERGPGTVLPWNPAADRVETPEQLAFQAQVDERLQQLFGETEHPVIAFARWLERSCGWEVVEHQRWGLGMDGVTDSLGPVVHPIEIESHGHRPELTVYPLADLLLHQGYAATEEELADLTELGWAAPELLNIHQNRTLMRRVTAFIARITGADPQVEDLRALLGKHDQPERPGRTPFGRAAGHTQHYQAALAELKRAFDEHPDTTPAQRIGDEFKLLSHRQFKLLGFQNFLLQETVPDIGPVSPDHLRTLVTTGDLEGFPETRRALILAGRWPQETA